MKTFAFVLLLVLSAAVTAQEPQNTPIGRLRRQSYELFENVYRRPEVEKFCTANPEGEIAVQVDGPNSDRFIVDCVARKAYLALIEAGVR